MVKRADIVEAAEKWLGVPWKHQGRTRHGIDCVGLPALIGLELGLTSYNRADYPRRPDGTFIWQFKEHLRAKPNSYTKIGDVLVFAEGSHPCHCGIAVNVYNKLGVIHAHATRRKVVKETLDSAKSVLGKPIYCFEFPHIED